MRTSLVAATTVLAASTLLTGCGLLSSSPDEGADEPGGGGSASASADLGFEYRERGEVGFIDQTLAITNSGGAAAAPDLDLVALDASGAELDDVKVVTAYGSDDGDQVVPAHTEVIDILKFRGPGSDEVADVRVDVADVHQLDEDVPPANDLKVLRFDIGGERGPATATLGAIALRNTYDVPITVVVVGVQYADVVGDEPQHFKQVSRLAGPVTIAPGEKFRAPVPVKLRARFYGSVKAYLTAETPES